MKKNNAVKLGLSVAVILGLSTIKSNTVFADTADNSSVKDTQANTFLTKNPEIGPGYYDNNNKLSLYEPKYSAFSLFYVSQNQSQFLNKLKPKAIEGWKSGVLPSITAAQAVVESEWGNSRLSRVYNNLFGMKGSYNGATIRMNTREESNGNSYYINDYFRVYPSWEASIQDHTDLLHNVSNYSNLLYVKDYHRVAQLLQQDGYATAHNYASTLISIIEANGLASWDQEAFHGVKDNEKIAKIVYVPGYGIVGFTANGTMIDGSNKKFIDGSKWKTFGSKIINGEEMYSVGAGQYIPKKYTDHYDNGVVTIHYAPGYGINAIRSDGTQIQNSNLKFKTGTEWKIVGVKEINGDIAYLVGPDTYIPKKYTQWGE